VVAALADALRLDDDDRRQLYRLRAMAQSSELCPAPQPLRREVAPTVTTLLERLNPTPSFVVDPASDVLAWNEAWDQLARPLGMLDDPKPNMARHLFLLPQARAVYPDWDAVADEEVGRLRLAAARWGEDDGFAALVDELRAVPDFRARWSSFTTTEKRRGTTRFVHPDLGELRVAYEVLLLPGDDEQQLVTWLPADDATATALAGTADTAVSPARLRIIG
jgi:hypothetical protein